MGASALLSCCLIGALLAAAEVCEQSASPADYPGDSLRSNKHVDLPPTTQRSAAMAQVWAACPPAALVGHKQHVMQATRRPEAAPAASSAWRRQQRHRRRPIACPSANLSSSSRSSSRSTAASPEAAALLDQFWLARGVVDEQQRRCGMASSRLGCVHVRARLQWSNAGASNPGMCNLAQAQSWRASQPGLCLPTCLPPSRRQLVSAAGAIRAELDAEAFESSQQQLGLQLPSLSAAWFLEEQGSSPQVR